MYEDQGCTGARETTTRKPRSTLSMQLQYQLRKAAASEVRP